MKAPRGSRLHEGRGDPVSQKLRWHYIRMSTHERRGDAFRAMATKIRENYLSM